MKHDNLLELSGEGTRCVDCDELYHKDELTTTPEGLICDNCCEQREEAADAAWDNELEYRDAINPPRL
jgi:hypothetical protein